MYTDVVPLTARMLSVAEKNSLHNYVKAGLPSSRAANVLRQTSNVLVTRTAARYISETVEYGEHCSSGTDPSKKTTTTTASRLFATLEKEGHDHIVLSSKGTFHANPGVQTSNFVSSTEPVTPDRFGQTLPSNERVLMDAFVAKHRASREVAEEDDMFIAVVWMTAGERSLFRKFPYVLKLDVTFGVNSQAIPFLTMTGKTSDNDIFTILRCFIPNEQA